jgi:hypothetical protein
MLYTALYRLESCSELAQTLAMLQHTAQHLLFTPQQIHTVLNTAVLTHAQAVLERTAALQLLLPCIRRNSVQLLDKFMQPSVLLPAATATATATAATALQLEQGSLLTDVTPARGLRESSDDSSGYQRSRVSTASTQQVSQYYYSVAALCVIIDLDL